MLERPRLIGPLAQALHAFIFILIGVSVLSIMLESVAVFNRRFKTELLYIEIFTTSIFGIEYLLRVWSAGYNKQNHQAMRRSVKFIFRPLMLIDLLSILPALLLLFAVDLRFLRIFRFVRIIRVFRLTRYASAFRKLGSVLIKRKEQLIVTFLAMFMLLLIASVLMYHIENELQPEKFSSIPASMWWAMTTLSTVGYGDMYPVTNAGKIIGSIISILGIGIFALPAGIIASGFTEILKKKEKCPHCGKRIH